MTAKNTELEQMHRDLVALVNTLSRKQEQATTVAQVKSIGLEISEATHRATLTGQLLFTAKSDKITDALAKVTEGRAALDEALKDIQEMNAFITGITKFLRLVDKVIDTAKLI